MVSTAPIPRLGQWPSALPRFRTDPVWRNFQAKAEHQQRHIVFSFGGDIFDVIKPLAGWVFEFDPNTTTLGNAVRFMASIVQAQKTNTTMTITEPGGGWLRTFNPATATLGNLFDVIATLAHDIQEGVQAWTVAEPVTYQRMLHTNDWSKGAVMDFVGAYAIAINKLNII